MVTKEKWTPSQWLAFGNRVKEVRAKLAAMILDVQHVSNERELDGLLKVANQLDKWKSKMEDVAARDVPGAIVTRLFYGEPMPEDAVD